MRKLTIYTDGAIQQSRKIGGWAAVILEDNQDSYAIAGRVVNTTSNRMELQAVIEALEEASLRCDMASTEIEIISDSQYVVFGATDWLKKWKNNRWKGAGGKVVNRDLWERVDKFIQEGNIKFTWVRGHNGTLYNEICDKLAVAQYAELDTEVF
jgi:ribonuclease HI